MSELTFYSKSVTNIFQMLGTGENDITKSIAWALYKCPVFMKNTIKYLLNIDIDTENLRIMYQEYEKDNGITDLEITDDDLFYIIIEAKLGWILPGNEQLSLYTKRKDFIESCAQHRAIVSMSECTEAYAGTVLPKSVANIPIRHLSWAKIIELASSSKTLSSNVQKRLLTELIRYLEGIMTMQDNNSNWVYVVALSDDKVAENSELSYIDIVNNHKKYFHPFGAGGAWPKNPPNYIAFRYNGKLKSIHHIEGYEITRNLHTVFEELPDVEEEKPHIVYSLGPEFKPSNEVRTGNGIRQATRVYVMLDTLFTSNTITEAYQVSQMRLKAQ